MLRSVTQPGKAIEPASVVHVRRDGADVTEWADVANWVRRRSLVVAGLGMIVAQLTWKGLFLSHFFFWQDDYHFLDLARDSGFGWKFLTTVLAGHLIPGPLAISWVLARVSIYNWGAASAITLVLVAAASLACLRLLRTLFGDRPAILLLLAVYLLTPLTFPQISVWSLAIEALPLHLATFMALDAHVRYLRSVRFRHAAWAAGWTAFALIFFEKAALLPLLLFVVTAAFFTEGAWLRAARGCLVRYWRAWLLYLAVVAAYAPVFVIALGSSSQKLGSPGQAAVPFMIDLVKISFVPGALGGPWQWTILDGSAVPASSAGLQWLAWITAAGVVLVSILFRRYAWRAWAILLGWLVIADMVPVLLGRTRVFGAALALDFRYVADAAPVLAVCVGLAFLQVVGRRDDRRPLPALPGSSRITTAAAAGVFGAFAVGSLLSVANFQGTISGAVARTYIADARAALEAAPPGTVIVNSAVPRQLLDAYLFGAYGDTAKVVGEMARGNRNVRFVQSPDGVVGVIDNLRAFNSEGVLLPVILLGPHNALGPTTCWPVRGGAVTIPLSPWKYEQTVRIDYFAWVSTPVTVAFGSQVQQITLTKGLNSAYLTVNGPANDARW